MSPTTRVSRLAYERYIHSAAWSSKRKERLSYDGWHARRCITKGRGAPKITKPPATTDTRSQGFSLPGSENAGC